MNIILGWVLYTLVILFIAWIIPGFSVENFTAAFILALIIGLINVFIKPFLILITLPINFLTLGVFSLVLNALLFMLAGYFAPGVAINGFWPAFWSAILLSFFGSGISQMQKSNN